MGAAIAAIVVAGTLAILVLVMISAKVGYFIIAVQALRVFKPRLGDGFLLYQVNPCDDFSRLYMKQLNP